MATLDSVRPTFQSELRVKLAHLLEAPIVPAAPVLVVKGPGGLGKTRCTAELLRRRSVVWFAPKNDHQAQLDGFLAAPPVCGEPLPGLGPDRPVIQKRLARDDAGACLEPDRLRRVESRGLGRHMMALACRGCPQAKTCSYVNWKPSSDWLFSSHTRLTLDTDDKSLFAGREIVVIDESPLSAMLAGVTLTATELFEAADLVTAAKSGERDVAGAALRELLVTACEVIRRPPPGRRAVSLRELARDLGYQFVRRFASQKNPTRGQFRHEDLRTVDPAAVRALFWEVRSPRRDLVEKLVALADALADDTSQRAATVLVLGDVKGIAAGHFKPLPVPRHLPVVLLDATADALLLGAAFERPVTVLDVRVEQPVVIKQTTDARYPAQTLRSPDGKAIDRLMRIVDRYRVDHPAHDVALILPKSAFEVSSVRSRVLQAIPEGSVRFFWSVRGSNDLLGFDALFVVGAPELGPLDTEARVRAFMTRVSPDEGERPFDYAVISQPVESAGGWRVEDLHGDAAVLQERGYGHDLRSFVYRVFHQDEYIQAILRARPFDPANKRKSVYFLSSTFLDELDVELVAEEELLGEAPLLRARDVLDKAARKMTIEDLAREVGVDRTTLQRRGRKNPKFWERYVAPRLLLSRAGANQSL